jgi:hypothetical protein
MDLTKKTETELKALAYDNLVQIEMCQMNIKMINEALAKKSEEKKKSK